MDDDEQIRGMLSRILESRARHFDPELLDVFLANLDEVDGIRAQFSVSEVIER